MAAGKLGSSDLRLAHSYAAIRDTVPSPKDGSRHNFRNSFFAYMSIMKSAHRAIQGFSFDSSGGGKGVTALGSDFVLYYVYN